MQTHILQAPAFAVSESEAATALGLSVHTLRKDRQKGRRFPFLKIGRSVRYDLARLRDVLATLEVGGPAPRAARRR